MVNGVEWHPNFKTRPYKRRTRYNRTRIDSARVQLHFHRRKLGF